MIEAAQSLGTDVYRCEVCWINARDSWLMATLAGEAS